MFIYIEDAYKAGYALGLAGQDYKNPFDDYEAESSYESFYMGWKAGYDQYADMLISYDSMAA